MTRKDRQFRLVELGAEVGAMKLEFQKLLAESKKKPSSLEERSKRKDLRYVLKRVEATINRIANTAQLMRKNGP